MVTRANTFQEGGNRPFSIKVHVDKANKRWAKFNMPAAGTLHSVYGTIIGHESNSAGLFIIDLRDITYLPATNCTASSSPGKSKAASTSKGGSGFLKQQRNAKRRCMEGEDDDDIVDIKEDISLTSPSFPSSPTIS